MNIFLTLIVTVKLFVDLVRWTLIYSFLALSTGIIYGYYAMILKVDEEEFGGHGALLQEGLFASTTLFLVLFYHLRSILLTYYLVSVQPLFGL